MGAIRLCLAFGKSQHGIIGWDTDLLGLWRVAPDRLFRGTNIPVYVHCMYQGMFAIITPALISGAVAERIRFGPYCLFIFLWGTIVYYRWPTGSGRSTTMAIRRAGSATWARAFQD